MTGENADEFYVPRRLYVSGRKPEDTIADMEAPKLGTIVVVLAEPGGGKTAFAEALARAHGIQPFTGAEFAEEGAGSVRVGPDDLVIVDGLDEVVASQPGGGADRVIAKLRVLNCPEAIITCRAAEWEGARSAERLLRGYGRDPVMAHFMPFSEDDQLALVKKFAPERDAAQFLDDAEARGLGALLENPETLRLLLLAFKEGCWPSTRTELFERAAIESVEEPNPMRQSGSRPALQALLDSAGEIFAHLLLSGEEGVDTIRVNVPRFPRLAEFGNGNSGASAAARTRLFRAAGGTKLRPMHRMLAEFLAARWLGDRLRSQKLSTRRPTTVIAPDGQVRTDLRGLHAWLATTGPEDFRRAAMARDPHGVFRYGDPTRFALPNKRRMLASLRAITEDDPYFRRADFGADPMVSAFFVPELRDDILRLINEPNRGDHLFSLLMDCMRGSPLAAAMTSDLLKIATDQGRSGDERLYAAITLQTEAAVNWQLVIENLKSHRSKESFCVALKIIGRRRGEGIDPSTIADTIIDSQIQTVDGDGFDLSIECHEPLQAVSDKLVEPILDRLANRMEEMPKAQSYEGSPQLRVVSSSVILLIERRFAEIGGLPTADRLWYWIRNIHRDDYEFRKAATASATLESNGELRRAIQALALRDRRFEENSRMALFRLKDLLEGIGLTEPDIAYHLEAAARGSEQPFDIELWASLARWGSHHHSIRVLAEQHAAANPQLALKWAEINRPLDRSFAERQAEQKVRLEKQSIARRLERIEGFIASREKIESGDHLEWLYRIGMAYLGRYTDIKADTPEQRVEGLVGSEYALVALAGLDAALRRRDLPTVEGTVSTAIQGQALKLEYVICAAVVALHRGGRRIDEIPRSILEASLASEYCHDTLTEFKGTREAIETVVLGSDLEAECFARRTLEPQIAAGSRHVWKLHLLVADDRFARCAGKLAIEWLERLPNALTPIQAELFEAALLLGDKNALVDLVRARCLEVDQGDQSLGKTRIEPEYRALWIPAAFLLDFAAHRLLVDTFADEDKERLWSFREIAGGNVGGYPVKRARPWPQLDVAQCKFVIEKFAPQWPRRDFPSGGSWGDTNPWDADQFLASCMRSIETHDDPVAGAALDALIGNARISEYHRYLRHLRAGWRKRQRDRTMRPPDFSTVQSLLKGGAPRSVADLQATMIDALVWLQEDVQAGNTNSWRPFWSGNKPRSENECRDRVVERIKYRFEAADVSLPSESRMPADKRADIVASMMIDGKASELPVEVKGQWHRELWTAASGQLKARYAKYINADGYGVYLVLWFGNVAGKNMPRRPDGKTVPATAAELQQMLSDDLPEEWGGRIGVFVLDVSNPVPREPAPARPPKRSKKHRKANAGRRPKKKSRKPARGPSTSARRSATRLRSG